MQHFQKSAAHLCGFLELQARQSRDERAASPCHGTGAPRAPLQLVAMTDQESANVKCEASQKAPTVTAPSLVTICALWLPSPSANTLPVNPVNPVL